MRVLRWAAELAVSRDPAKTQLGVDELEALLVSKMLGSSEEDFVYAALLSANAALRQAMARSPDAELVPATDPDMTRQAPVSSEEGQEQKGGGV
jgi:hypothetical protein